MPLLNRRRSRFLVAGFGIAILAAVLVSPLAAADFRGGNKVVIAADEVIEDDLYVSGQTVRIDGTVRGDVIASGREITLNGIADGDLIAAGQAVIVNGQVGDDIRMAGMALQIGPDATVGDDVVAAGFSLEVRPGSHVGGTMTMRGYQAIVAGGIDGNVDFAGAGLDLRGPVAGDVRAQVDSSAQPPGFIDFMPSPLRMPTVAPGLSIADRNAITGDIVQREPGAVEEEAPTVAAAIGDRLRRIVAISVVGLLLIWLLPGWMSRLADHVHSKPREALLWGLGGFIALGVAVLAVGVATVVLGIITGLLSLTRLVGLVIVLGLLADLVIGAAVFVTVMFVAPLVVSLAIGRRLISGDDSLTTRSLIGPLLVGLVLVTALRAVPVVGPLVGLVVVLAGLGSVAVWVGRPLRRTA